MPKHNVNVKLTVTGCQVTLYLLSDSELVQFLDNSKLENPEPLYEVIQSDGYFIYSGIDPIDGDTSIEVFVDGTPIDVDGYIVADDDKEAKNLKRTMPNKLLINDSNYCYLEGDIPKNMHALVVRDYFKSATADVSFKTDKKVCASDFELIIKTTDTPCDFSEVTYDADLLPTQSDLVGILFDGVEVGPELDIDNHQSQEFFLFERDASGKLQLNQDIF